MNIVMAFAQSILHGDDDHKAWLLGEASKFIEQMAVGSMWTETEHQLPVQGIPVIGYHPDWIDEDFNHRGYRECFTTGDGTEWISAKWFDHQDCYETEEAQPQKWTHMPDMDICIHGNHITGYCEPCGRITSDD